jgi:hypothetical protein
VHSFGHGKSERRIEVHAKILIVLICDK